MVQILRALSGLEEKETLQLFAPKKLSKSGSIFRYNSIVCVCKWRDKRDVLPISTKHSPELMNVTKKRGQTLLKPEIVVEYNKFIIGVDRHDQMLSYYTCDHKTMRWYEKVGIHILQMMLYSKLLSLLFI